MTEQEAKEAGTTMLRSLLSEKAADRPHDPLAEAMLDMWGAKAGKALHGLGRPWSRSEFLGQLEQVVRPS